MVWVVPLPVTVTTRMTPFFVGNFYKPSFATLTRTGGQPKLWFHFSYMGFFILPPSMFFFSLLGFPLWQRVCYFADFSTSFLQERQNLSKSCRPRPPLKKKQPTQAKSKQNKQVFYIFFYLILSSGVKIDFFAISVAPSSPGGFLPGRGVHGA